MVEPFLFKFKKTCSTQFHGSSDTAYDNNLDMIMVTENKNKIPMIFSDRQKISMTKKADIETGEDQKDSLIFR